MRYRRPLYSESTTQKHEKLEKEADKFLASKGHRKPRIHVQARSKRHKMGANTIILASEGDPCPRCEQPTQVRQHAELTEKVLKQPYYYARWFYCTNKDCQTTLIMPERYKMWNSRR